MAVGGTPGWTWADAVFAAVLAVGLATVLTVLVPRRPGVPVAAALVFALAATVLTRGETVLRIVAGSVVVVAAAVAVLVRRRNARNEIAPPDRRC